MTANQARKRQVRPARIEALDSLRAVCALCVVIFHFETTGILTNLPFFRHGWMLVDFFFVLSGFVITGAYGENIRDGFSIGHYLVLRVARVWPLHLVMLACFLALELSKLAISAHAAETLFSPPREIGSLVANMFLLQVFGLYDHLTWNVPSWSIAAEFWVYLIAALIFRFASRALVPVLTILAICCAALMAAWGAPFLNLAHDGSVVRCLYGFCVGSLTYAAILRLGVEHQALLPGTLVEVAFVGVAVTAVSLCHGLSTLIVPPLFGAGVFIFAHQRGAVSRVLNWRLPVWLGSISYSLYMTHAFIIGRVLDAMTVLGHLLHVELVQRADVGGARILTGSEALMTAVLLLTLCLVIAVSYATYRWVEQPCNALVRRRLGRDRSSAAPTRLSASSAPMPQVEGVS